MDINSQCHNCKNLQRAEVGYKCAAFPDGVPEPIIFNQFDHRNPYPNAAEPADAGVRYEPIDPTYATGFVD